MGERRFLGLMASAAYRQSPREIPVLRRKVQAVLDRAGYPAERLRRADAAEHPRELSPRGAVPDRRRRAVRGGHGHPRHPGPPAAAPPRAARRVRPVHVLPGVPAARPAHHGPAHPHPGHPAGGLPRREHAVRHAGERIGPGPAAHHRPDRTRRGPGVRRRRDRGPARRGDALVDRRPVRRAGRPARRGARGRPARPLRRRVPARPTSRTPPLPRPSSTSGGWRGSAAATTSGCTCTDRWRPRPGTLRFKLFRHGQSVTSPTSCRSWRTWASTSSTSARTRCARPAPSRSGSTTSGCATSSSPTSTPTGCASASRRPSPWSGAATWRTTGSTGSCSAPGCGGARSPSSGPTRSTSGRSAPPSRWTTPWRPSPTIPRWPAGSSSCSRSGWIPMPPSDRDLVAKHVVHDFEGGLDAVTSLNEDRVLRALLRVVEATLRTNYFQVGRTARPSRGWRSSSPPGRSPTCPCRGRCSRSSSTRPASRASTCAAGRSPAAGCAGPTGRRTSGPRSSG